jgi:hypothetical protein
LLDIPDPATQLPKPDVPEHPELWGAICGNYGPTPGPNTNFRQWTGFGAEVTVLVDGNHLVMRSPDGAYKDGVQLHPVDENDPLSFEIIVQGAVQKVLFKRNLAGYIDRLQMGTNNFSKRAAPDNLPVAQALYQGQTQLRQQWAKLVYWYMTGMPNKLKALGRIVVGLAVLRLLWGKKR